LRGEALWGDDAVGVAEEGGGEEDGEAEEGGFEEAGEL
jgi:hypothetical protein